jgi:hypothetical protein
VRSRKILLLGAGALVLVVLAVVLVTRGGGPSFEVERGDGSAFPLRGSLADDQGAIDDALEAWRDGRGAAADGRAARINDHLDVHVLYAGRVEDRDVVIVRQGDRLIAMHQPFDRGWVVGEAQDNFASFDASPVEIDDAVLLPVGDWTYLPMRAHATQPKIVDGLISSGSAYGGEVEPGFVVEGGLEPVRNKGARVFDTEAGLFRIDDRTLGRIADASRHPGRLLAIHAALVGDEDEPPGRRAVPVDVLWTGRVPGVREAAVVARGNPHRLGLGLVRKPDGLVSSAESVSLGARTSPLGAHRRDFFDEPYVGAAYVGDRDGPTTLVAAATGSVDRIELLVGTRRLSRPRPVAVVPVDWDTTTTDAVVLGRTARGAVIAPLVPGSP